MYGDSIDRADLLSILCFAGYLCSNMCDFFTDYAGNDQGDIELAMWVLGGGSSGLSHCELLLFGYDDIASYLLQWASGLGARESAVQVLFPYACLSSHSSLDHWGGAPSSEDDGFHSVDGTVRVICWQMLLLHDLLFFIFEVSVVSSSVFVLTIFFLQVFVVAVAVFFWPCRLRCGAVF